MPNTPSSATCCLPVWRAGVGLTIGVCWTSGQAHILACADVFKHKATPSSLCPNPSTRPSGPNRGGAPVCLTSVPPWSGRPKAHPHTGADHSLSACGSHCASHSQHLHASQQCSSRSALGAHRKERQLLAWHSPMGGLEGAVSAPNTRWNPGQCQEVVQCCPASRAVPQSSEIPTTTSVRSCSVQP
jgi:hypothetical protein